MIRGNLFHKYKELLTLLITEVAIKVINNLEHSYTRI